jgi:hypothetical protein
MFPSTGLVKIARFSGTLAMSERPAADRDRVDSFNRDGFAVIEGVVSPQVVAELIDVC